MLEKKEKMYTKTKKLNVFKFIRKTLLIKKKNSRQKIIKFKTTT